MNNLLEINMQYLYIHQKTLYKKIEKYLDSNSGSKFELNMTENNFSNLIYYKNENERYLVYSEEEVTNKKWLNEHESIKNGFHEIIMLGFGLSYHLADLLQTNANLHIYVYEPRIDIFLEALKIINIKDVLEHPQVKMFDIGSTELDMQLFLYYKNTKSLFKHYNICIPFYVNIDEQFIKAFYDLDYSLTRDDLVNIGYNQTFGVLPFRNAIQNLNFVNRTPSLEVLHDRYIGCTALVVGGGPSLEIDIELIRQYKDEVLIIAAGSSIQSLLYYGVKPHLVVSIDPGRVNGDVFKNIDHHDIPMAFGSQIYMNIPLFKETGMFHFSLDTEPLTNLLLKQDITPVFYTTNSVTGTALQVAKYVGASRIVLVGQDFSFPNKKYYSQGSTQFTPENMEKVVSDATIMVENVTGGTNNTNVSLSLAKDMLEELIEKLQLSEEQIFNTSSLGAVIKGAPYVPIPEILSEIKETSYNFNELMELSNRTDLINSNKYDVLKNVKKGISEVDKLAQCCKKTLKIIDDFEVATRKNNNLANNKLVKLEQVFSELMTSSFFTDFVTKWCSKETREYDANVKYIDIESNMIKKSKLLKQILVPYVQVIQNKLVQIKEEFEILIEKLQKG